MHDEYTPIIRKQRKRDGWAGKKKRRSYEYFKVDPVLKGDYSHKFLMTIKILLIFKGE